MKKIKALIWRSANFLTVRFALPGSRLVSFTVPRDLDGPELELVAEILCDQVLVEQACRCARSEEQQEAVN